MNFEKNMDKFMRDNDIKSYRSVLDDEHRELSEMSKKVSRKTKAKEKAFYKGRLSIGEQDENFKTDYSKNVTNFQNGIPSNAKVIVTRMNHLIEVQHMKQMNFESHITNLPMEDGKRRYAVNATGEIFECAESENRSENYNSLGKTFKKMRYLINNNFTGGKNEKHVILTVRPPGVTDTKILYEMFDKFMKRLRYKYMKEHEGLKVEYINVIEPHASGKWHCHVLLRFDGIEEIYIPNEEMANLWSHGFVTVKALHGVDNIGAYLSAYLSDIDVTGENINNENVVTKTVEGQEKKFLKGGRLHFYDVGVNIYRSSKGIKEPYRENTKWKDIKKEVGHVAPNYSHKISIENENYKNEITYLQYNLKR